jgi:hypothetical protein
MGWHRAFKGLGQHVQEGGAHKAAANTTETTPPRKVANKMYTSVIQ